MVRSKIAMWSNWNHFSSFFVLPIEWVIIMSHTLIYLARPILTWLMLTQKLFSKKWSLFFQNIKWNFYSGSFWIIGKYFSISAVHTKKGWKIKRRDSATCCSTKTKTYFNSTSSAVSVKFNSVSDVLAGWSSHSSDGTRCDKFQHHKFRAKK